MINERARRQVPGWAGLVFLMVCGLGLGLPPVRANEAELAGWQRLVACRRAEGNVTFAYDWLQVGSLELLIRPREGGASATLVFDGEGLDAALDKGGTTRSLPVRAYPVSSAGLASPVEVTFKLRNTEWALYLDDRLAATLAAPFAMPGEVFIEEYRAGWVRSQPLFRAVPQESYHTDFMIEEGAPNQLYPWRPESGAWRIHTALDDALARPETNMTRVQQAPLTADKSPNFYSLKGAGQPGIITTGFDYFDNYNLAAAMMVNKGEAGLVFYHLDAENHYGFTLDMLDGNQGFGILRLWRVRGGERTVLAEVRADLFPNQWQLLQVQAHTDEIVCLVDHFPVLRVAETLPVGGKVGLYVNHDEEIWFDDVFLKGFDQVLLRNAGEIRYQMLGGDEAFFRNGGRFGSTVSERATELRVPAANAPQRLLLGRSHHQGIFFGAEFQPAPGDVEFGLLAGYRGDELPYYRYVVRHEGGRETFRLDRVSPLGEQTLDSWSRPLVAAERYRLAVDATEEGWLRFLEDDQLVLLHPVEGLLAGAPGLWVGAGTSSRLRGLHYNFERERHKERLQQNEVFANDNFMRHWASAEGQWIAGADGKLWHKGDFFNDFSIRLPWVTGAVLHAGVPEDANEGTVRVAVGEKELTLVVALPGREPEEQKATPTIPEGKKLADLDYTLHHEGYWLWITIGGERVLRHRLAEPLPGRQVRAEGMKLEQFARSLVTRINVIDDFFSESPFNWTINGGTWQIVNRFQCTPSWSHMIGESEDNLAALWYKALFEGDMTLEFYAGTRHGDWYYRMGDLNCTIMAQTTSPSSGYTVTCTEWDQELSQKWTTLRRNGEVMVRSDDYLVPRRRAGLVRKFLNPLVSQGRPYHGAWYYIKLRKMGDKLEYYFDDHKIFETTDPEALRDGLVGIWTFMHSMTVAQVKITFDSMRPRPIRLLPPPASPPPATEPVPAVTLNGFPLQALEPSRWQVEDTVGYARPESLPGATPGLAVRNRLGSGRMLARPDFPPLDLGRVAGWRFQLKRTPDAELNVHYSIGEVNGEGVYTPRQRLVHRISGDRFADGMFRQAGATEVPGSSPADLEAGWTSVEVWIPEDLRPAGGAESSLKVRFEGIGTMGDSEVLMGLTGNRPGAAYYLRQFAPVFYGVPNVESGDSSALFVLRESRHGSETLRSVAAAEVGGMLARTGVPGLNTAWLRVKYGKGDGYVQELAWVSLPETVPWELAWHEREADALVLRRRGQVPDPRFAGSTLALENGQVLPTQPGRAGELVARLPRTSEGLVGSEPLSVRVTVAGATTVASLDWKDRPQAAPPVLLGIKGLPGFGGSFESTLGRLSHTGDERQTLGYGSPEQGRFLQVRNTALNQRLHATFGIDFPLSKYPLFQFRYRGYDMTYISLAFSNGHPVRLSEDLGSAARVRLADQDLRNDGGWQSWQGMVTDAFASSTFDTSRFQPSFVRFGSAHDVDQTGRYTRLDLDDVVFGPAVSSPAQLAFMPEFFAADGLRAIQTAVAPGPGPYAVRSQEQLAALDWLSQPIGEPIVPKLEGLADGVHHLLYRAVDSAGTESRVFDVPFLLDTKPLEVTQTFEAFDDPGANGLRAVVRMNNHGGAPWAIEGAAFQVGGKNVNIPAWTSSYEHAATSDTLYLNYPLIMRSHLDAAGNGDTVTLTVRNIADGAGNSTPDLDIPYTIDYAKDKTGPTWYWLRFGSAVHWFYNWDGSFGESLAFSPDSNNQLQVVKRPGAASFLNHLTYRTNGDISRQVSWKPAAHPWLSCRIYLPEYRRRLQIFFTLATNRGNYTFSITPPEKSDTELNRGLTFPLAEKQWIPISANVAELFRGAGLTAEQLDGLVVNTLTLSRRNARNQEAMYLDDFFLHGVPTADTESNRMTWYAFDLSGVERLDMVCLGPDGKAQWTHSATSRTVDLHELSQRVTGSQWFQCQAYDKAGKASSPFYLPLAGQKK